MNAHADSYRYGCDVPMQPSSLLFVLLAVFPVFGVAIVAWIEGVANSWLSPQPTLEPKSQPSTVHIGWREPPPVAKPMGSLQVWIPLIGYIVSIVAITGSTIATGISIYALVAPDDETLFFTLFILGLVGVVAFVVANGVSVIRRALIALDAAKKPNSGGRIAAASIVSALAVAAVVVAILMVAGHPLSVP
jgi:hypothetical protein